MDSNSALTIREAFGYLRRRLSEYGIASALATQDEIDRALATFAGEMYLQGYMDHVAVAWQNEDGQRGLDAAQS